MINDNINFQLRNLQLFRNGSELASLRLEYYKVYGLLFESPSEKLKDLLSIEENMEILHEEYLNLFIRPNTKYVFPCGSAYKKQRRKKRNIVLFLAGNGVDRQRPDDHVLVGLNYMRFLIEREKRQWLRKNSLEALDLLHQQQDYLLGHLYWLPDLCAEILKKTTSRFYRNAALNLESFFQLEKLLLEIILLKRASMMN
ncbi:MAG: molecular chaperone TorD family protein [bacterium]